MPLGDWWEGRGWVWQRLDRMHNTEAPASGRRPFHCRGAGGGGGCAAARAPWPPRPARPCRSRTRWCPTYAMPCTEIRLTAAACGGGGWRRGTKPPSKFFQSHAGEYRRRGRRRGNGCMRRGREDAKKRSRRGASTCPLFYVCRARFLPLPPQRLRVLS